MSLAIGLQNWAGESISAPVITYSCYASNGVRGVTAQGAGGSSRIHAREKSCLVAPTGPVVAIRE